MNIKELDQINNNAIENIQKFRGERLPGIPKKIDEHFHRYKNRFPYYGYIEASIFEKNFVMYSCNDDLVAMSFLWFGRDSYEPGSMKLWDKLSQECTRIFDVGSFSGVYSLLAATANNKSKIVSFEAARRTYGRLLCNIQTNHYTSRITAVNKAISDKSGFEIFHRYRGENILGIGDSFIKKELESLESSERVETISIDEYVENSNFSPEAMKIDVEGAEILALHGMEDTLEYHKPEIIIEVTPKTSKDVYSILRKHNYEIWSIDEITHNIRTFDGQVSEVGNLFASRS